MKELKEWLDLRGISPEAAADLFGKNAGTIRNWRSAGVPANQQEWVRKVMAEHDLKEIRTLPNRIILEPTRDQFRAWGKAALSAGQLIDDWAASSLDDAAAEDEADQTGFGASPDPVYRALKAAEPGEEYTPKKEASA